MALILFLTFTLIVIYQPFQNYVLASSLTSLDNEQVRELVREEIGNLFIELIEPNEPTSTPIIFQEFQSGADKDWILFPEDLDDIYNDSRRLI
jgi:hypothetical protein